MSGVQFYNGLAINVQLTDCNNAGSCDNSGDHTTVLGNEVACSSSDPHTTSLCQPGRTVVIP
jgi:hypothetical protein